MLFNKIAIVFYITTFISQIIVGQEVNLKFKRYSISNGLSQNTINCLSLSKNGFVWVGTDDGLNRYDGANFNTFRYDLENKNSISNNSITSIYEDTNEYLWVGTNNGLNLLNTYNYTFKRFYTEDIKELNSNSILKISEKDAKHILVASTHTISTLNTQTYIAQQLFKSDELIRDFILDQTNLWILTEKNFYQYNFNSQKVNKLPNLEQDIIYNKLIIDNKQHFWIGTNNGVFKLNPVNLEIIKHYTYPLINNHINSLLIDKQQNIWIGTENGVYLMYDNKLKAHFKNEATNLTSLSYNSVLSMLQDDFGVTWIGTYHGLNNTILNQLNFNHFSLFPEFTNDVAANLTWKIIKDEKANLWIATGGGLYVYNETKKTSKHIPFKHTKDTNNSIYALVFDKYTNLWIGGTGGYHYIPNKSIETVWNNNPIQILPFPDHNSKETYTVTDFAKKNDTIWSTIYGKGIYEFTNINKELKNLTYSLINPSKDRTNNFLLDHKQNKLWMGTSNGVKSFDLKSRSFKNINLKKDKNLDLEISVLNTFNDSILWVGSFSSGLIKYNLKTNKPSFITTKNGLANNSIYGILNTKNYIWVSTNNGLSRINQTNYTVKNFDTRSGLQSNEFGEGAYFKDKTGKLYFGGLNGINSFYSKNIISNTIQPKIIITEFKIFDKAINAFTSNKDLGICQHSHPILYKDISRVDSLNLTYQHKIFSFKVAAIHSQNEAKNKYAYKLSSVDKDWNVRNISNNQFSYTNLRPGSYSLYIKASNSDGIWSKPKTIFITIVPPYWQTNWFYLLISLLVIGVGYFLLKFWKKQIKLQERQSFLQEQNDQKTAVIKEIHHRIKNNLQVVTSLLRVQASKIEDKKVINMLKKTQNRVLSMATIHEKMYQSQNLHSLNSQEHFAPLIQDLIKAYGVNKKIDLQLNIESANFQMQTLTPLGLIINELISNSLKYAFINRKKGTIYVSLKKLNLPNQYELSVGDDGSGFDHSEVTNANQIGTKLIHSFVKQLRGTIELLDAEGTHYKITFFDISA